MLRLLESQELEVYKMCNLTIDINAFCPLRCEFCYQNLDGSVLSENEIFSIVDEHPNFDTVEIGGGEPFSDNRLVDIIKGLRSRDRKVHVSTSGVSIPEGLLDLSDEVRSGVQIQVSLHASTPELFNRITQTSNEKFFDRVVKNLKKLKEKYTTLISSTIYQSNLDDVPNIVDLANNLRVPIRVNLAFPTRNNVDLLTSEQIDQLRGYLLVQRILTNGSVDSPLVHKNNCTAITQAYGIEKQGICPVDCNRKKYVSPKGKISQCEFLEV